LMSVFDRCKIFGLFLSISCSLSLYDNKEFWNRRNNGGLIDDLISKYKNIKLFSSKKSFVVILNQIPHAKTVSTEFFPTNLPWSLNRNSATFIFETPWSVFPRYKYKIEEIISSHSEKQVVFLCKNKSISKVHLCTLLEMLIVQ
jgi:hypothetical protein